MMDVTFSASAGNCLHLVAVFAAVATASCGCLRPAANDIGTVKHVNTASSNRIGERSLAALDFNKDPEAHVEIEVAINSLSPTTYTILIRNNKSTNLPILNNLSTSYKGDFVPWGPAWIRLRDRALAAHEPSAAIPTEWWSPDISASLSLGTFPVTLTPLRPREIVSASYPLEDLLEGNNVWPLTRSWLSTKEFQLRYILAFDDPNLKQRKVAYSAWRPFDDEMLERLASPRDGK